MTRIVLVTGGGSGLGKAVAARFSAAGAAVIITGRNAGRLAETAAELGVKAVGGDATDPGQVAAMAAEVGGELDVLVNMAGGNTDFTRTARREDDPRDDARRDDDRRDDDRVDLAGIAAAWRANLDANLLSAVLTTSAVLPVLRPGGSVINVGSIGAEYASTSYGAAKAALAAWTAGLSAEIGPRGLTANVISPGYTEQTGFFHGRLTGQRRAALVAATHDGRAGQPDDIAQTAYFLASDGARHITGQVIHVNGGAHTTR